MKKILVLFLTIYMSIISFSEINDKLGLLEAEDIVKIEEKVDKISKETDLKIYINYLEEVDTLQLKEVEKSVIINLLKKDSENLKVSINLTQDIDIEEYRENIENTLDNLEEILGEGKYGEYTLELLGSLEEVLLKSEANDNREKKEFSEKGNNKSKVAFLIVFIGGLFYLKRKKNK